MPQIDIFKGDAFSVTSLSKRVNEFPFVPGQAGKLNIFEEIGIPTTTVEIENQKGTLVLIPDTPRGGDGVQMKRETDEVRYFRTAHLKPRDVVTAAEIQDRRSFGAPANNQQADVLTAQEVVDRKLRRMNKSLDATVEFGRLAALKGIVTAVTLASDGTLSVVPRYNLFTEFGLVQQTVDFELGTAATDVLGKCTEVREKIQTVLGGDGDDGLQVVAFCGETWFKKFISHAKVAEAYKYYQTVQQSMNPLQQDLRYKGFTFGNITFYVYRGNVSGVPFVAASEVHFFPVGVPDLYQTYFGPADYMETVNTTGLPRYAKMAPDPSGFNRFWQMESQTNPISVCTRPGVLIKGTTSN